MRAMFRSLRRFNYRVWFFGALISNVGAWMQSTAQSWVVLTVLTDGDAAAMGACYHKDVAFSDEIFPELHGDSARAMWTMLCERGKDLTVTCSNVHADSATGRAQWDAWYTFSGTGRRVHNVIRAEFTFEDGLIVRHVDRFGFWTWARQALGPVGAVLRAAGQIPVDRASGRGAPISDMAWHHRVKARRASPCRPADARVPTRRRCTGRARLPGSSSSRSTRCATSTPPRWRRERRQPPGLPG